MLGLKMYLCFDGGTDATVFVELKNKGDKAEMLPEPSRTCGKCYIVGGLMLVAVSILPQRN